MESVFANKTFKLNLGTPAVKARKNLANKIKNVKLNVPDSPDTIPAFSGPFLNDTTAALQQSS